MIRFSFRPVPDWPALGWIARLTPGSQDVQVTHGPRVETHDDWFGEVVWAGDFGEAAFDQTDAIFGSGARVREACAASAASCELVFVSAGSTVDRLQSIEHDGHVYVSNSLACLLARTGAAPQVADRSHFQRLGTIRRGIDSYDRFIPTSAGPVRLCYFHNLVWTGGELVEREKPDTAAGGFPNFDCYRHFLDTCLRALGNNAQDPRRRSPFPLLGTVSAGYDSAASAILARDAAGLAEAITFFRPDGTDAGQLTAGRLGISLAHFARESWRQATPPGQPPEAPFIAGDAKGEDVFIRSAEARLSGCMLITGHHGGGMWARSNPICNARLPRGDRSGLALTEWRLSAGFIHCPVPYIGARHMPDLLRISQSQEMQPWSVGGSYDRPIPRRIIEEAGVPRESFGWTKRAGSILLFKSASPLSPASARDLKAWLRRHSAAFVRQGTLPPAQFCGVLRFWRRCLHVCGSKLAWIRVKLDRGPGARLDRLASRMLDLGERDPLFDYAFPWALDCLKRRYFSPHRAQERLPEKTPPQAHPPDLELAPARDEEALVAISA